MAKTGPRYHLGQPGDSKDVVGDAGARFQTKMTKREPLFSLNIGRPVDATVQVAPTMLAFATSDFEADKWAGGLQVWKTNDDQQKGVSVGRVEFQCGVSALTSVSDTCLLAGLDDGDIQVLRWHECSFTMHGRYCMSFAA